MVFLQLSYYYFYRYCYYYYFIFNFSLLLPSDIHSPRNISCSVSPIGSPLLYSRSPQHMSGRMSPSPISSPHTASGSSTPLTGGSGALPFHHPKQPTTYLHDGMGTLQRSQNGFYMNGSAPFNESRPELFQGMPQASHAFRDIISSDNSTLGNQIARRATGEFYDVQSVLADRVSQQLLRDHVKLNPTLDFSLSSPMLDRTSGI